MKTDIVFRNNRWVWYVISAKRQTASGLLATLAHGFSKDKITAELRANKKLQELKELGIK